jgi:DNA adenine methylase
VKWAGGKRLLLDEILPKLPLLGDGSRFIEPFLGGGAVFFGLLPKVAILSDLNADLIHAYEVVRDDVESLIERLARLPVTAEDYYRIRDERPRNNVERAARFIYLNKTCFNGLYRVNVAGEFNVPYGRHRRSMVVCDRDQLRTASRALANADIKMSDFGRTLRSARSGDLVYCDPPYTTAHRDNGFVEYNSRVFSLRDQRRLATWARVLLQRGVSVAISNADHPSITRLYAGSEFKRHRIERWSTIAGSASKRYPTTELLIVGRPTTRSES